MTIDDFKEFVFFIARKATNGNNPTISQFNLAMQRGFVQWVMKRYNNPAEYQPGMPIPRISWQNTQKISDDLRFLLERRDFAIPSTGQLTIPNGTTIKDINTSICPKYLHASSFRTLYITQSGGVLSYKEVPITQMNDNEIGDILSSNINVPSHRYPKLAFYNNYIQFYPKNIGRITFTYLREPTLPVWGFTTVNNRPVYDATTSVDIESPDETHNEIAGTVLSYLGISIKDGDIVNYAQQMKNE